MASAGGSRSFGGKRARAGVRKWAIAGGVGLGLLALLGWGMAAMLHGPGGQKAVEKPRAVAEVARDPVQQNVEAAPQTPVKVEGAKPTGFVALFNGKDLTAWKVHDGDLESWGVDKENGILFGLGKSAGWLMAEKEYGDFGWCLPPVEKAGFGPYAGKEMAITAV